MSGELISLQVPTRLDYSRDIVYCHPYLQERWPKVLFLFQQETKDDLLITCTWRSVAAQKKLFAQGRAVPGPVVTRCDGEVQKSEHNFFPSRALDVAVNFNIQDPKKHITWDEHYYHPLVSICKKVGLESGGSWESFKDWPHIQLPKEIL